MSDGTASRRDAARLAAKQLQLERSAVKPAYFHGYLMLPLLREGDEVSAVALVVETEAEKAAEAADGSAPADGDGVIAAEAENGSAVEAEAGSESNGGPEPEPDE